MRSHLAAIASIAALAVSQPCFAQSASSATAWDAARRAELAETLKRGVACTTDAAEPQLRARMEASDAPALPMHQALTDMSFAADVCAPVRDAALTLASELAVAATYSDEREQAAMAAAVASIVSEAFIEADLRAAQLTFEVGPPPRNITRGRISGF